MPMWPRPLVLAASGIAFVPPHPQRGGLAAAEVGSLLENLMKTLWLAMLLMVIGVGGLIGCEASGEIDPDDGEVKLDIDD